MISPCPRQACQMPQHSPNFPTKCTATKEDFKKISSFPFPIASITRHATQTAECFDSFLHGATRGSLRRRRVGYLHLKRKL